MSFAVLTQWHLHQDEACRAVVGGRVFTRGSGAGDRCNKIRSVRLLSAVLSRDFFLFSVVFGMSVCTEGHVWPYLRSVISGQMCPLIPTDDVLMILTDDIFHHACAVS